MDSYESLIHRLMKVLSESIIHIASNVSAISPLLTASGGSSGERAFEGVPPPTPLFSR